MVSRERRPVVLAVYDRPARFQALVDGASGLDNGRLAQEFEFIFCDSLDGVKNWYRRNPGVYVAAVIIGVDFSEVDSEQKLASFPLGIRPAGVALDVKRLQGFIIYYHLRHFNIEPIAPVILHLSGEMVLEPAHYIDFIHVPGTGECHFGGMEPGEANACLDILNKLDRCALRPLSEEQRLVWRERHSMVIGRSRRMAALVREIEWSAPTDSIVLVLGPPGSGKELVAQAIHRLSYRYSEKEPGRKELLTVQMTAMEKNLCVDELFGHEAGAFTDARTARAGIFETARGSTVFLDEIGEIDHEVQKKLLRVIEYRRIKRLGSSRETETDVRIIAATNRTIEELQQRFRSDFYTRLVQQCIVVPSVTERWATEKREVVESDIAEFFDFFTTQKNRSPYVRQKIHPDLTAVRFLTQIVLQHLSGERPLFNAGNIRTLRAVILQAYDRAQYENARSIGAGQVATAVAQFQAQLARTAPAVRAGDVGGLSIERVFGSLRLAELEKLAIREALIKSGGNQSRAAEILGIHRDTLRNKIKAYGIG
ncbi:MAG: sigma-54-dependent transcriptional regulator [candidate division WOR-3 bacterium]